MDHPFEAYRLAAHCSGDAPAAPAPFLLEHQRLDQTPAGSFRPHARLILAQSLQTSGFWHDLPGEEIKTLLLVLTFLTPNGRCRPTLPQLSEAMRASEAKARARMQRLEEARWQGKPVLLSLPHEGGVEAWTPAPRLLDVREAPPALQSPEPLPRPAGREAVIAWSRAVHARPRQEVEADIARRMGWGPPAFEGDDPAVAEGKRRAYGRLTDLGLSREQALDVLARFDLSRIGRQVEWLPHRSAKNPARFLLAAIEGDYDPPASYRRQALQENAPNQAVPDSGLTVPDMASDNDLPLPDASLTVPEAVLPAGTLPAATSRAGDEAAPDGFDSGSGAA